MTTPKNEVGAKENNLQLFPLEDGCFPFDLEKNGRPCYDPNLTTMQQASVRCGLRVKRAEHINCVLLEDDGSGLVVYEGNRFPSAWEFMRNLRGLQEIPSLPGEGQ
ncbi:hypothetical protein [Variovorax sp. JS1663]|uniref:hypothetical protein n=1 Tax=Variovorax sp. JS1663 TaxID=1851577 RepID=UPI00117C5C05|nr:hypothetical protein [Variovorax sp. JS1663]